MIDDVYKNNNKLTKDTIYAIFRSPCL